MGFKGGLVGGEGGGDGGLENVGLSNGGGELLEGFWFKKLDKDELFGGAGWLFWAWANKLANGEELEFVEEFGGGNVGKPGFGFEVPCKIFPNGEGEFEFEFCGGLDVLWLNFANSSFKSDI